MTTLEALRGWLAGFAAPDGTRPFAALTCEYLGPQAGAAGLFPAGSEVTAVRQDIAGGCVWERRAQFVLALLLPKPPGDDRPAAATVEMLESFTDWATADGGAPVLGENTRWTAAGGALKSAADEGLGRYEVTLTALYAVRDAD